MADNGKGGALKGILDELPVDRLKGELQHGMSSFGSKAIENAGSRLNGLTDKLNESANGGGFVKKAAVKGAQEAAEGGSPVKGALKGGAGGLKDKVMEKVTGGGGGGGGKKVKVVNIIESIDVGVPVSVAYNAWTQYQDFAGFMKKVDGIDGYDTVEQGDEVELSWKAQVFWSHRTWEAKVLEQVPDEKIVWQSKGAKGHVDGAVTFHEIAPNLTRILVVLEYHPQGLFERTGNIWRAQGRRARLELKHFRRHVMTVVIQNPDDVEGWRGVIEDGEVQKSHDDVMDEEQEQDEQDYDESEDEYDEPEDEYDDDAEEPGDEEAEAEEYDEPEDEYDEDGAEPVEESDEVDDEAEEEPVAEEEEPVEDVEDVDETDEAEDPGEEAEEAEEPVEDVEEEEPEEEKPAAKKPRRRRATTG